MANKTIKYTWKKAKSFTKGRTFPIRNIVLHSSDGREEGDITTLTEGKVSSNWYVTRAGRVYSFVRDEDTAYHAGVVFNPSLNSNAATIGIEQEHYDPSKKPKRPNEDWPDTQIDKVAQLVAYLLQTHGLKNRESIKTHAEIAKPKGRKQDPYGYPFDKFYPLVDEYLADSWSIQES
jgi:N-acetyl-anhydromuramyl-L-alanine amidase AmpD